ncbi:hypothetical protein FPG92_09875 [Flavobacterium psychrophilum]|nr:hypothetical protein FPG92_09875 [Flavobacterium psychrophilum]
MCAFFYFLKIIKAKVQKANIYKAFSCFIGLILLFTVFYVRFFFQFALSGSGEVENLFEVAKASKKILYLL